MEKNRLAEALKKHQMLVEYNFYIPKGVDEQETPPPPAEPTGAPAPPSAETPPGPPPIGGPTPTDTAPTAGEEPKPNEEGDVELDITDLVNSTKDTREKIDGTNELLNNLISKFDELDNKISSFDQILNRMDKLEQDFNKRLPTPVEKLEMRSMDSYPYSVKLSDFWNEESDNVDTLEREKNYTLTPDEVKKDYDPSSIKTSFDIQNPEDQDFQR